MKGLDFALLAGALAAASMAHAATNFTVSYQIEQPGAQSATGESTSTTFSKVDGQSAFGVETFTGLKAGVQSFSTDFGTGGLITGAYSNVQINNADQYGGAGGAGQYPVAFPNTPYQLTLTTSKGVGGVNYFGFWLSALDPGNYVTFYNGSKEVFQFRPIDLIDALKAAPDSSAYYGNPNPNRKGQDGGEPFAFVNFYDTGATFNKVVFQEVNYGGGYESDNHTVGHYIGAPTGKVIALPASSQPPVNAPLPVSGAPEPGAWSTMILGIGLVGAMLRRRRAAGLAASRAAA